MKPKSDKSAAKKKYPLRECSVCSKEVQRLDIHLVKLHRLQRGTAKYREIVSESLRKESDEAVEEVEISAGKVVLSKQDGLKQLLTDYEAYLKRCTALAPASVAFAVKTLQNRVMHMTGEELLPLLSASAVSKLLRDMDAEDPPGFLPLKMPTYSSFYVRKIIQSAKRVVEFFASSAEEVYQLSDAEKRDTEKALLTMNSEYFLCFCA